MMRRNTATRSSAEAQDSPTPAAQQDRPSFCLCPACAPLPQPPRNATVYERVFAWGLSKFIISYNRCSAPVKQELFERLASSLLSDGPQRELKVLEIGMGTAPNLSTLVQALTAAQEKQQQGGNKAEEATARRLQVVGLDKNPAMWSYAKQAAQEAGLEAEQLELLVGDAERLPFPDASFDAAVCTLVMCSVRDPSAALREARRVLRPGGKLLILEHVAAPWPEQRFTRAVQEALTPLFWRALADGCELNRDTASKLEATPGFDLAGLHKGKMQGLPGILQPHMWGVIEAVPVP